MTSRIIVLQPECKGRVGHHYAQIKSLENAIAPMKPLICVHRHASETLDFDEGRTFRWFSGRIAGSVASPSDPSLVATPGSRELDGLLEHIDIGPEDHLVFLSACAETVLALLQVLAARGMEHWPQCYLRFLGDERRPNLETIAHQKLGDLTRRSPKLHLYSEFAANVAHVASCYDKNKIHLSRLPTMWPDQAGLTGDHRRNGQFTIGVFGTPRRDKGKYRLAPIFAELLAQTVTKEARFEFSALVQKDSRRYRALRLRASFASKLRSDMGRVSFLPAEMSSEDFISHIRRCDVVLLPYNRAAYERRGSGVMVDAVAHGVPVICQSGTAMCELIESGNGLAASNVREYAACLLTMAQDLDQYRTAADKAARIARSWSTDSLLTALRQGGREAA